MEAKAFAKINLSIKIKGKNNKGYHYIDSFMQLIDLYDEIKLDVHEANSKRTKFVLRLDEKSKEKIELNENNLCLKAAEATLRYLKENNISFENKGVLSITLTKNIPIAAGLGGGSADAAVTSILLLKLLGIKLSLKELYKIGISIGSDVPFLMMANLKFIDGINNENVSTAGSISSVGEEVCLEKPLKGEIFLKKLPIKVSTKTVYDEYDKLIKNDEQEQKYSGLFFNDLERSSFSLFPKIREEKIKLENLFPQNKVLMSGSGPSLFVFFDNNFDKNKVDKKRLYDVKKDGLWLRLK